MNQENTNQETSGKKTIAVVGDGWSAMGAVASAIEAGASVIWIAGSGAHVFAPLPTLDISFGEEGVHAWNKLARFVGLELGEAQSGTFLREFRNKAFRPAGWVNSPELEQKKETRAELLWDPERSLAPLVEARFELTLGEIEEQIRARLLAMAGEAFERIEGNPVSEIRVEKKKVAALILGSGREIEIDELFFCDRWSELPKIKNMPKSMSFQLKRDPVGVLQAVFHHETPLALGVNECFFASLHKESGETVERHVWGYFSSDGKRSFWTVCLSPEEAEDNHEIAKKLRRTKSALSKIFCGPTWVPEGSEDFMATVSRENGEQVRFEEFVILGGGEPLLEAATVSSLSNARFLTDGYGPAHALSQVSRLFGAPESAEVAVDATQAPSASSEAAPESSV